MGFDAWLRQKIAAVPAPAGTARGRRARRGTRGLPRAAACAALVVAGLSPLVLVAAPAAADGAIPHVTDVTPDSAPLQGGDPVEIDGRNLSAVTGVFFGAMAATSFSVADDDQIFATAPPQSTAGPVEVTVTSASGTSTPNPGDVVSYLSAPLVFSDIESVDTDAPGEQVEVDGDGLWGANGATVGAQAVGAASIDVPNDWYLSFPAPGEPAPGTYPVQVSTPSGSTASTSEPMPLVYVDSPVVNRIGSYGYNPDGIGDASGPLGGGQTFVIDGSGLSDTSEVLFGSKPALDIGGHLTGSNSDSTLTGVVPPGGAPGPVDVTVVTPQGRSPIQPDDVWWYDGASAARQGAPVVSSVSTPGAQTGDYASGPDDGETVDLAGSGFTGATSVNFGTVSVGPSGFEVSSDTSMTVTVPPGLSRTVPLTVTNASGTSAMAPGLTFTVTTVPVVEDVTVQDSGTTETATVRGSGFTGATAVDFAGQAGSTVQVVSDQELTSVLPASASSGDVTVKVGSTVSAIDDSDVFGFGYGMPPPQPELVGPFGSSDYPWGPPTGGDGVVGNALCFEDQPPTPTIIGVDFGSVPMTDFSSSSAACDGAPQGTVPPSPTSGPVAVTLETTAGPSPYEGSFWYYGPPDGSVPTVTGTGDMEMGIPDGGLEYAVYGTGFADATGVTVGGVPAQFWTPTDDFALVQPAADTPLGVQPVVVTSASGSSAQTVADLVDVVPANELDFAPPIVPPGATTAESATSDDPSTEAVAAAGSLVATASGVGALTVSAYAGDPESSAPPGAAGSYGDVAVSSQQSFESVTVTQCDASAGESLSYWTGSSWQPMSPQSFDSSTGCVVATLNDSSSTPRVSQLTGTPLALVTSNGSGTGGSGSGTTGSGGGSGPSSSSGGQPEAGAATSPTSTPTPDSAQPAAHIAPRPALLSFARQLAVVGGRVALVVRCRQATCSGQLRLDRGGVLLAQRRYRVAAGHALHVSLTLDKAGLRLLEDAADHRLRVVLAVTLSRGAATRQTVTLQAS